MITTAAVTFLGVMGKKYFRGAEEQSARAKTALAVLLNISASIAIIVTNKWLYTVVKFPNLLLTLLHFVSTFACLLVCQRLKLFKVKRVPIGSMIPLASCFCGFVVLTNLSLESNSVGTYQVAKVLTTPCIVLIQYNFYRRKTNIPTLLTVVIHPYFSKQNTECKFLSLDPNHRWSSFELHVRHQVQRYWNSVRPCRCHCNFLLSSGKAY